MRVYIAGPYSADTQEEIDANVARADQVARDLLAAGYTPFCPHSMTYGWEKDERFQHDPGNVEQSSFMRMDLEWLSLCGAVVFLGRSPGASMEKDEADRLGIPVFTADGFFAWRPKESQSPERPTKKPLLKG